MEYFTCYICMEDLLDAFLCPKCSKPGCQKCLFNWIGRNFSCPHCRHALHGYELIQCKWMKEVVEEFKKMTTSLEEVQLSLTAAQLELQDKEEACNEIQSLLKENAELKSKLEDTDALHQVSESENKTVSEMLDKKEVELEARKIEIEEMKSEQVVDGFKMELLRIQLAKTRIKLKEKELSLLTLGDEISLEEVASTDAHEETIVLSSDDEYDESSES